MVIWLYPTFAISWCIFCFVIISACCYNYDSLIVISLCMLVFGQPLCYSSSWLYIMFSLLFWFGSYCRLLLVIVGYSWLLVVIVGYCWLLVVIVGY